MAGPWVGGPAGDGCRHAPGRVTIAYRSNRQVTADRGKCVDHAMPQDGIPSGGGPVRANAATEYIAYAPTLKAKTPFANGACS